MTARTKLNSIEVLNSRPLTDSYISDNEFISISNVLKEYNDMKEAIRNQKPRQFIKSLNLFIKQCYNVVWSPGKTPRIIQIEVAKTNKGKLMLLSKCVVCSSKKKKKKKNYKKQETSGLLNSLGLYSRYRINN